MVLAPGRGTLHDKRDGCDFGDDLKKCIKSQATVDTKNLLKSKGKGHQRDALLLEPEEEEQVHASS